MKPRPRTSQRVLGARDPQPASVGRRATL